MRRLQNAFPISDKDAMKSSTKQRLCCIAVNFEPGDSCGARTRGLHPPRAAHTKRELKWNWEQQRAMHSLTIKSPPKAQYFRTWIHWLSHNKLDYSNNTVCCTALPCPFSRKLATCELDETAAVNVESPEYRERHQILALSMLLKRAWHCEEGIPQRAWILWNLGPDSSPHFATVSCFAVDFIRRWFENHFGMPTKTMRRYVNFNNFV